MKSVERMKQVFRRVMAAVLVAAAAAVLLSTFFLPVIQVSGSSMEPALSDGDIILLMKSGSYSQSQLCCISWQNKLLLKRVIGLPGDVIDIDKEGSVYVNGSLLDEPYVTGKSLGECDINFPCVVPENKLFVMGDRRDISIDSRSSAIGCIDEDQIVGRVLMKIWSDDPT
ncbi:MAG: signal peptidase I [Ruminococcus sp.]|nr:signal peptidase I [Ruminococcus sp.]